MIRLSITFPFGQSSNHRYRIAKLSKRSKEERKKLETIRFFSNSFIRGNESRFPRLSRLTRATTYRLLSKRLFLRNRASKRATNAEQRDCGEQTKRRDLSRWPCSGQISTAYSIVKELTVRYNLVISDHFHEEEETVKRGRITRSASIPSRFPPRLFSRRPRILNE